MSNKKKVMSLGAASLLAMSMAQPANASQLLSYTALGNGAELRTAVLAPAYGAFNDGKCEEGGEGKCGEGKCGEGKCGDDKAGEGKCGDDKAGEGKCGDDKAGEGKCGDAH